MSPPVVEVNWYGYWLCNTETGCGPAAIFAADWADTAALMAKNTPMPTPKPITAPHEPTGLSNHSPDRSPYDRWAYYDQ